MLGLNTEVTFYQWQWVADDPVGGATGTYAAFYANTPARISARRPTQQALEAGLEVVRVLDLITQGQQPLIYEKDQVEVVSPTDSPYYGERFRITGLQHDSRRSGIGHTEWTLERIERSRGNRQ